LKTLKIKIIFVALGEICEGKDINYNCHHRKKWISIKIRRSFFKWRV